MTPEGKIKADVKAFLNSLGDSVWFYMPVPMGYGRRGIKDFLGCYKGRSFGIETKSLGKELKPWQALESEKMRAAGVAVFDFGDYIIDIESFKAHWHVVFPHT